MTKIIIDLNKEGSPGAYEIAADLNAQIEHWVKSIKVVD